MKMKEAEKRVRVGIVVASLDILGGQAIAALRLLEGLAQTTTIDAEILAINPRLPTGLRWLQRIKYVRTLLTFLYYVATLLVKVRRFDVLHVFSASNFSFLLAPAPAVLIGKLYGRRVILNYHSGEAEAHLRNWPKTTMPVLRLADRVVVPSGFLVEVFARFGIRAAAIYNTVDLSKYRFHRHHPIRPVILANRNFEDHYNVACALQAFALIQRQVSAARLIVAGDGSQRRNLYRLADELGLQNVEFVGAVAPAAMAALYDSADIYLNASVVDNMPLSILEAFACGLAVVTTNAGGIPYVVQDNSNGLLVERGDHQGLAGGVLRLLDNSDLAARLIAQARNDCQRYTWEVVGHQWVQLYEALAGKQAIVQAAPQANQTAAGAQKSRLKPRGFESS